MSEQGPFASFVPSTEAAPEPPKAGKRKGKDKSTKPKVKAAAVEPKPKKTRKVKASNPPVRAFKIDVGLALTALAGLTEKDAELLETVADILSDAPKKARRRIAFALTKIFA